MRLHRDKIWDSIYMFAKACGGDTANSNMSPERLTALNTIEGVLDSYQDEVNSLAQELGIQTNRVIEKNDVLKDIGKASFLLTNTAQGDVLLLPSNLCLRAEEGIKK
jgi:hypothetical protein